MMGRITQQFAFRLGRHSFAHYCRRKASELRSRSFVEQSSSFLLRRIPDQLLDQLVDALSDPFARRAESSLNDGTSSHRTSFAAAVQSCGHASIKITERHSAR